VADVDGIRLDVFVPGCSYEVGNRLGAVFLAEGWAEPVDTQEPALVIPIGELNAPPNLIRELFPPYADVVPELARERRRRPRGPRTRH
jgi:hypothetical protein